MAPTLKVLALCLCTSFLGACSGTSEKILVPDTKIVVIAPPEALYRCPPVPMIPPGKLTQRDVATLLINLYDMAFSCKQSLQAIQNYVTAATHINDKLDQAKQKDDIKPH